MMLRQARNICHTVTYQRVRLHARTAEGGSAQTCRHPPYTAAALFLKFFFYHTL